MYKTSKSGLFCFKVDNLSNNQERQLFAILNFEIH